MNNIGQFCIWIALIAAGMSASGYLGLCVEGDNIFARNAARLSFAAFTAGVTVAGILLMGFILNHEFVYSYVGRYSSRELPLLYLVSSFWAGQEGSFLLWVFLGAWLGVLLMYTSGRHEPRVMLVYNLNTLLLTILLIKQSPFHRFPVPPADGNGMNMLLQDPWMAIHPPIVFLGYAAFAIPFAYAISALWQREYDGWIEPGLPWAIFAFVTLGAGIVIGGFWSYKVLGWGGYWGWDPVENASLLPWLAGTALVHGMIVQHTQKRFRKTNFFLAAAAFILVIYCTFLTRSGVLADFSVHSFTDLGITGWLVFFMGVFIALFLWLLAVRARDIPVSPKADMAYFSREAGLLAAILLLGLSCLVTGLGTSAPLITRMMEKASKVSAEFYVQTNLPLAVLMLLLLSFVPLLSFGRNYVSPIIRKLPWAGAGAVVALAVTLTSGVPRFGVLLIAVFAGSATGMNLALAGQRMRKLQRWGKRFSLASGALVHLGVGLMFLGIVASSAYDRSEKARFFQGATATALGYQITLSEPRVLDHGKGKRLEIPLNVGHGTDRFSAQPDIYQEESPRGQTQRFVHPFIKRGSISDLYISPVAFDPGEPSEPPDRFTIKKGGTTRRQPYTFTFEAYDIPAGMGGDKGMTTMRVGARLKVTYKDQKPVRLTPVLSVGEPLNPLARVKLPGPGAAFVVLDRINAETKTITLIYDGPGAGSEATKRASVKPGSSVILDVSTKPGMTVLWAGALLMLVGGAAGIVRHWRARVDS
jgi:cytochrome c-type biogenesis protein CcmF